jgi:Flp pilus assembly pilin Flp
MRNLFQDRGVGRSWQNSAGATAIEYAIIAGLIGLGLVGSLVTTRGSLSAVFGVTAT